MDAADIIRELSWWPQPPQVTPLAAGYTNQNYRIACQGKIYYGRVAADNPRHGISRANEAVCARLAATAGIAPQVVYAQDQVLITAAVDGLPLAVDPPLASATIAAIARLLSHVHQLPAPDHLPRVDPRQACGRYLALLTGEPCVQDNLDRFQRILADTRPLGQHQFVHGDPFPENFIRDSRRLWLIDWEYAGRGDPAYDLAYVAMSCGLSKPQIELLVSSSDPEPSLDHVLALLDLAALRDLLWYLAERDATGATASVPDYARRCSARLGITI